MYRTAPAPTRATTSFLLSVGLVNIPLSVLSGIESTRVERHEFLNGDVEHPVGRQPYDKTTGQPVDTADIVRMATASDGSLVVLNDDEIEAATMPKGVAEVVSFVPLNKLGNYLTERVDQVRAKTSGMNKAQIAASERAFGLFLAGLANRKVAALIKVALRGPARYAAITPDGDMLLLYPVDAIRQPKALDAVLINDNELDLMGRLIDQYPKGTPKITDDTAAVLQQYVNTKALANGIAPGKAAPNMAAADDLFAALLGSMGENRGVAEGLRSTSSQRTQLATNQINTSQHNIRAPQHAESH